MSVSLCFIGEGLFLHACVDIAVETPGLSVTVVFVADGPTRAALAASHPGLSLLPADGFDQWLRLHPCDFAISANNMRIIKADAISRPRRGFLNFHNGPLPAMRGVNIPAWAILGGKTEHGVTWHELVEQVDAGDVYESATFPVDASATFEAVQRDCFRVGIVTFRSVAAKMAEDRLRGVPQDPSLATYFSMFTRPASGTFAAFQSMTAQDVVRLSRALSQGPDVVNTIGYLKF